MPSKSSNKKGRRKGYKKFAKKSYRNKYRNMKVSKYDLNIRYFKRKCKLATLVTNTFGYLGGSFTFQLNVLPNYNEFTNLFDLYSIRYVKLYFVHRATTISMIETVNDLTHVGFPNIICTRDYDDSAAPSSDEAGYDTLREYAKAKTFSYTTDGRTFMIGITPAILSETYRTGITSAYSPKFKQFIDCNQADVPHYGIKYVLNAPNSSGGAVVPPAYFDVYATYYLAFKTVR